MFRVACAIMAVLLLLAAVVQVNDPDASRWVAFYAVPAGISIAGFRRVKPSVLAGFAAVGLGWAAMWAVCAWAPSWLIFAAQCSEEHREFGGQSVVGGWMLAVIVRSAIAHARGWGGAPRGAAVPA